jgi:putative ATPase
LPEAFSGQNYFPKGMERQNFYKPIERGFEREMAKRIAYFSNLRKKLK